MRLLCVLIQFALPLSCLVVCPTTELNRVHEYLQANFQCTTLSKYKLMIAMKVCERRHGADNGDRHGAGECGRGVKQLSTNTCTCTPPIRSDC